jgi:uncharacterized glyoxalase superfamily protein PhnB
MSESIEVEVDQATAFKIFTEELDDWWGNGPNDAWDSSRVVEHRIEPGLDGRLLEVYDDGSLELGRITVWDPPEQVSWNSSVDDVRIEVSFEQLAGGGTRVRVVGTAFSSGAGEGLAVVRMAPQWLPRHLARRSAGTTRPALGRLHLVLRYREPAATGRWLAEVFGFETPADIPGDEPTDPDQTWIELRTGDGRAAIILWGLDSDTPVSPAADPMPWIYVDDLDAHLARTEGAGAVIISPVTQHGFRSYTAADREGRHWLFAQAPASLRGDRPSSAREGSPLVVTSPESALRS